MPTSYCKKFLTTAMTAAMALLIASAGAQTPPAADGGSAATGKQQTLALSAPAQPVKLEPGSVTFIGNATVIIRYAGLTILTDPNFLHKGDHVHLGYGLTSERLTDPAIDFDKLPPIDLVLLSHLHGDHFDHLVEKKLKRDMPIVTTVDGAAGLEQLGFTNRYGLNTWDTLTVTKGDTTLRINAMPGRHGPPVLAGLLPDVMGSMLEFSVAGGNGNGTPPYRMYISGDTLVYDDIQEIPRRYPDIDLALLHLGGTRILGVMKVTMDGEDGVRMMQIIAPHHAIPIHYNDYTVFKSPLSDFQKAVTEAGLQDKVTYLKHGDTYRFRQQKK
jgi:L-ascorbate metabolism protein UlaG (beta-lactamase superfamily)